MNCISWLRFEPTSTGLWYLQQTDQNICILLEAEARICFCFFRTFLGFANLFFAFSKFSKASGGGVYRIKTASLRRQLGTCFDRAAQPWSHGSLDEGTKGRRDEGKERSCWPLRTDVGVSARAWRVSICFDMLRLFGMLWDRSMDRRTPDVHYSCKGTHVYRIHMYIHNEQRLFFEQRLIFAHVHIHSFFLMQK